MGKASMLDLLVDFNDVRAGEFGRGQIASDGDEGLGDVLDLVSARQREVPGTEQRGQSLTRAFSFGCASSFCSASNCRAARLLVNAFRFRAPDESLQSA